MPKNKIKISLNQQQIQRIAIPFALQKSFNILFISTVGTTFLLWGVAVLLEGNIQ
ncbi:hypothetical protein GF360_04105 [candidate division WWE3 bacterium]|nr:hypothetical protein [candidate division WWE3 bacterium]